MKQFRTQIVVAMSFGTLLSAGIASESATDAIVFEQHVRPIFKSKCGKCHSDSVQKGALNLATMSGIRLGGESGESAIAETADDSLIWQMIEAESMPPEDEPQLTTDERRIIHQWLKNGGLSEQPATEAARELTQHDVYPILLLRCTTCHGARLEQGGVDLRTVAAMKAGGDNGVILRPGDPDGSLIIQRIESNACPPRNQLLKYFVKRPSTSEVQLLRDWIAAGAREFDVPADVANGAPDPLVTMEDRQHWAFQPPVASGKHDTIDGFLSAKLQEAQLPAAPPATRDVLIRRAFIDLTGLPPGIEEWNHWHHNSNSDWFAEMVNHLLDSPRYGERWGRYWLDVAGYADSEGGVSADPVREVAWKYRDYVIQSFNKDKPYDQFLREQLAGDELVDVNHAETVTPEIVDNLIATGFLRMGIDQTGSRTMNFVPERLGVIGDAIAVLGSGVMGLTLECVRCHSHKYDPIPHRDYYRLKAIFQGAYDEHDWLTFRNRMLTIDTPERTQLVSQTNPPLIAKVRKLQATLKKSQEHVQLELLKQHYPQQPETDRIETLRALRIADNNRSQTQRILVEMLQQAEVSPDELQPESVREARRQVAAIQQQIETVQRQMQPSLKIRALWDRGEPSPTYILRRGEHDKPGPLVGPGVPSVLTDGMTPFTVQPPFPGGTPKTGRRLALANWLTNPDHPLTARVIVNRIWHHHFGAGIVRSLENFGRKGDAPSHPLLLDWLAVRFVQDGWSIKKLHQLIMNSEAYQRASVVSDQARHIDPANRLLSHMTIRRLDAESLRDSLLFVSDSLETRMGGPPDLVSVSRSGLVTARPEPNGLWRRSIYLPYRRTEIPSMMATFDYPVMGPNCISRSTSTVSLQALMLMNGNQVRELASTLARQVENFCGEATSDSRLVDVVYQKTLSRLPTEEERRISMDAIAQLTEGWNGRRDLALESFCHAILNSAEFLYVD